MKQRQVYLSQPWGKGKGPNGELCDYRIEAWATSLFPWEDTLPDIYQ